MKKLLLFTMLTFGLTAVFSLSSFSQNHPPQPPRPPSTGPVVSVTLIHNDYWGELFFNTLTGQYRNGNIYFFSGGSASIKSVSGTLFEEYLVVSEIGNPTPEHEGNYYYHFEGTLTYKFSSGGPEYSINLDGSNNCSLPY